MTTATTPFAITTFYSVSEHTPSIITQFSYNGEIFREEESDIDQDEFFNAISGTKYEEKSIKAMVGEKINKEVKGFDTLEAMVEYYTDDEDFRFYIESDFNNLAK